VVVAAIVAGLITGGAYWFGQPLQASIAFGVVMFLLFMANLARAEVGELRMILDQEAPGWRERNAGWTSTWDWNRKIKRKFRKEGRPTSW
jgi:hypothetical protein